MVGKNPPPSDDSMPLSFMQNIKAAAPTKQQAFSSQPTTSSSINVIGTMFHHYRIEQELGRGGMGVVYKAIDSNLNRTVAIKMILPSEDISENNIKRFMQEARAIAVLDHPNVIKVFEVGEEPQNYFVMEYIIGSSLDQLIKDRQLKPLQSAIILMKAAEALYSAHKKKIIHRDLKPANIMITSDGEPKVMDFGLAKVENSGLSRSSDFLGTPVYMSPEQAGGLIIDHRSDVYSLGATLYEVLTGRHVFQGDAIFNIIYQILNDDPIIPRKLNPDIPIDLEAICLKCLEKSPNKRYANMRTLAKDLKNFSKNQPIIARPPTKINAIGKWIKRNKALTAVFLISTFIIVTGAIAFMFYKSKQVNELQLLNNKEQLAKNTAKTEGQKAKEANKKLATALEKVTKESNAKIVALQQATEESNAKQKALYQLGVKLAYEHMERGDVLGADIFLSEKYCASQMRHWEWHWLNNYSRQELESFDAPDKIKHRLSKSTPFNYNICRFSPDGQTITYVGYDTLGVWDINDLKQPKIDFCENLGKLAATAISPNGNFIVWVKGDSTVELSIVSKKPQKIWTQRFAQAIHSCVFSHNNKILIIAGTNHFSIWQVKTGKLLHKTHIDLLQPQKFYTCAISPDNRIIALGDQNGELQFHSVKSGRLIRKQKVHDHWVTHCIFSHAGKMIASASKDQTVKLWHVKTGKLIRTFSKTKKKPLKSHANQVNFCVFSPKDIYLASGGNDRIIKLWDVKTGNLVKEFKGHEAHIRAIDYSPGGNKIISVSEIGTIKLWQLGQENPAVFKDPTMIVKSCDFHPKNSQIVSSGLSLIIWDAKTGDRVKQLIGGHFRRINCCKFGPQGKFIVSGCRNGKLVLWNAITGDLIRDFQKGEKIFSVTACDFSPDGKKIVSTRGFQLRIWDVKTGKKLITLEGHKNPILSCVFSPDGAQIISADQATTKLWDTKTGKQLPLNIKRADAQTCIFHPDKRKILTINTDRQLRLWDLKTHKLIIAFKGHDALITSCAFSPGGKRMISADSNDYTIRIWNVETGEFLFSLKGHTGIINDCIFSRDGRKIVSVGEDGTVRVWDAGKGAIIEPK